MPRPRSAAPRTPKPRYAICVDDLGTDLQLNGVYRILYEDLAEREGLLRVCDEWGEDYGLFEADRFLFVRFGRQSKANPRQGQRVIADALEREARLSERGTGYRIGDSYARTLKRIFAVDPLYGEAISFALGFWDDWVAAARSGWRTHAGSAPEDWIRAARRVAREVRRGREAVDLEVLDRVEVADETKRPRWFRGVYGRRGRIDR
ncbi:MAG: hypothetical protein ACREQQ_05920 [Candidatus Binatia bacterium]